MKTYKNIFKEGIYVNCYVLKTRRKSLYIYTADNSLMQKVCIFMFVLKNLYLAILLCSEKLIWKNEIKCRNIHFIPERFQ